MANYPIKVFVIIKKNGNSLMHTRSAEESDPVKIR